VVSAFASAGAPEGETRELAAFFVEAGGGSTASASTGKFFEEAEHTPLIRGVEKNLARVKALL